MSDTDDSEIDNLLDDVNVILELTKWGDQTDGPRVNVDHRSVANVGQQVARPRDVITVFRPVLPKVNAMRLISKNLFEILNHSNEN